MQGGREGTLAELERFLEMPEPQALSDLVSEEGVGGVTESAEGEH